MTELYNTHRPTEFKDVVGQDTAVTSTQAALKKGSHQFIFWGDAGCGKTSLARIVARHVGCHDQNLLDIPAAVFTGVDAMRKVQDTVSYSPMGGSKARAIIIDECHRLSAQAWDSLLKAIEEPAKHVYWFFCTTDYSKVPKTIKTRCVSIKLNLVSDDELANLLYKVCDAEKFKTPDSVLDVVIREAQGSPRQALTYLSSVAHLTTAKEAAKMLHTVLDSNNMIELCRLLVAKGSWQKAVAIVGKLEAEEANPEGVRIVVMNYVAAILKKTPQPDKAKALLHILYNFATPYNTSEKLAPLLLSIGGVIFND